MKQNSRESTSPKAPPRSADLTSLSSFLDQSLVLPDSPGGSGSNTLTKNRDAQSELLTTSHGDDDEVVIEFDLQNSPTLRGVEPSSRKAPPSQGSSSTARNLLTDDEANDLRIRFNMKVASVGDEDAAGSAIYLDKENFFELVQELKDEGRLVALPPLRELSYLYMESDSDENGYLDFEALSGLYIKIRDGVLPKSSGMAARMKKSFFKMSGGPHITPNSDDMPADERLENKYGINYIFQDPPGADAALSLLKKYFTRSSSEFLKCGRKGEVSMTRTECLELLPKMLDGKERYDSYKCNGGYHELPWGPGVISLKKLTALFDKKNCRPDLIEGSIKFGDFAELYVECHLGRLDMTFQTAPRPSALNQDNGLPESAAASDQALVAAAAMALSKVEADTAHRKEKKKKQHKGNSNTTTSSSGSGGGGGGQTSTSMAVVQVTPPPPSLTPPRGGGDEGIPEVEI